MQFKTKKVQSTERVCLRLKQAREAKGLSLSYMAEKLRMSKKYIEAIEACRFQELPFSAMYQKKLIMSYAKIIGMNEKHILDQFIYEELGKKPLSQKEIIPPGSTVHAQQHPLLTELPSIAKYGLVLLFLSALAGYFFIQIRTIITPPTIQLETPAENRIIHEPEIQILGSTDPSAQLDINGQALRLDETGNFETSITLQEGINRITLQAKTRHSDINTLIRTVVYSPLLFQDLAPSNNASSTEIK